MFLRPIEGKKIEDMTVEDCLTMGYRTAKGYRTANGSDKNGRTKFYPGEGVGPIYALPYYLLALTKDPHHAQAFQSLVTVSKDVIKGKRTKENIVTGIIGDSITLGRDLTKKLLLQCLVRGTQLGDCVWQKKFLGDDCCLEKGTLAKIMKCLEGKYQMNRSEIMAETKALQELMKQNTPENSLQSQEKRDDEVELNDIQIKKYRPKK